MKRTGDDSRLDQEVEAFLRALDHPLKPAVVALRQTILGASPVIREGIKWNSPSFRTADWFATVNLRARGGGERVWLILHTGARKKTTVAKNRIADPEGLLEWLAADRCLAFFTDRKDVLAKRMALQAIVRTWIGQLPGPARRNGS